MKRLIALIMMLSMVLLIGGCKSKETVTPAEVSGPASSSSEVSQEFTETADDAWNQTAYKANWFKADEKVYNEALSGLSLKYTNVDEWNCECNVYETSDGKMYEICGNTPVPLTELFSDNDFMEKTGKKIYRMEDTTAKTRAIAREDYEGCTGWVNASPVEMVSLTSSLLTADNKKVEVYDLSLIANTAGTRLVVEGTDATLTTTAVQGVKNPEITLPLSVDKVETVTDTNGNNYFKPYYDSKTQKVFVTRAVLKNIIGWDISEVNGLPVILFDDVYLPTEASVFIKSFAKQDASSSETTKPVETAPQASESESAVSEPASSAIDYSNTDFLGEYDHDKYTEVQAREMYALFGPNWLEVFEGSK